MVLQHDPNFPNDFSREVTQDATLTRPLSHLPRIPTRELVQVSKGARDFLNGDQSADVDPEKEGSHAMTVLSSQLGHTCNILLDVS